MMVFMKEKGLNPLKNMIVPLAQVNEKMNNLLGIIYLSIE
jgi:hypothetical protein